MTSFEALFGPPPDPANYRDSAQLAQQVRNRYAELEKDFQGAKMRFLPSGVRTSPDEKAVLSPQQALASSYVKRITTLLKTGVYVVVFDWERLPVRALTMDLKTLGGSSNLPFREPRPWLLPIPEEDITKGGYDKIILKEVVDAIKSGVAFPDLNTDMLPAEIQKKNAENIAANAPELEDSSVSDLPSI